MGEEGCKSELDLFSTIGIQTSIKSNGDYKQLPSSKYDPINGSIEFHIVSQKGRWLDLNAVNLEIKCHMGYTGDDTTPIPVGYEVYPEKNILHSLFENCELHLNEVKVSTSNGLYNYRAYLANTLGFSNDEKNSLLSCEGYFQDVKKWTWCADWLKSKIRRFNVFGRIHTEMMLQDKLIPPGVDVRIKLTRSNIGFDIIKKTADTVNASKTISLNIDRAVLHVKWIELHPFREQYLERALIKQNAIYPIKRIVAKSLALIAGMKSYRFDNVITGPLPEKVIFCLIDHSSSLGDASKDSFRFSAQGLREVSLLKNGTSVGVPFHFENTDADTFTTQCTRPYQALFSTAGLSYPSITQKEFVEEYCIFCFDLTVDCSSNDHSFSSQTDHGVLSIKLDFDDNLKDSLNVIMLNEFSNTVEIDSLRNVILDY